MRTNNRLSRVMILIVVVLSCSPYMGSSFGGVKSDEIEKVITALASKELSERIKAGQILWFQMPRLEVTSKLTKVLDKANPEFRTKLVDALVEQVGNGLDDSTKRDLMSADPETRQQTLAGLFKLNGQSRKSVDQLINDLKSESGVRLNAAVEIGRRVVDWRFGFYNVEIFRLITALTNALDDKENEFLQVILWTNGKIGNRVGREPLSPMIPKIIKAAESKNAETQDLALGALTEIGIKEGELPASIREKFKTKSTVRHYRLKENEKRKTPKMLFLLGFKNRQKGFVASLGTKKTALTKEPNARMQEKQAASCMRGLKKVTKGEFEQWLSNCFVYVSQVSWRGYDQKQDAITRKLINDFMDFCRRGVPQACVAGAEYVGGIRSELAMDFFRLNDPMYLEVNEELGDLVLNKQVEFLHRACEMNYGKSCGDLFDMLSVPAGLGNPAGLPKKSEEILPFDADTKKQLVDRRNQSASKCAQTNQDSCDQLMILEFVLSPNKAKPVAERLCALGVPRGCRMLGYMIERGIGSDSSDEKAKFFYQKACDLKDRLSCEYLEKIWPDFYNSTELAMRKCESQNDKSACQKFVEYTLAKESLNLLAEERTYYHDCLPSPQVPEKAFRAACRLRIMDACAALDDGYNRCNTQCGFIAADSCEDAE